MINKLKNGFFRTAADFWDCALVSMRASVLADKKPRRFRNNKNNSGATIIELIIVIIVLAMLFSYGTTLFIYSFKTNIVVKDEQKARSHAQFAFEKIADDLRNARAASSNDLTPNPNSITFLNNDTESISYSLSASDLIRNGNIVAGDVSNLTFTYLKQDNTTTTDPTLVRCIVISATFSKGDSSVDMTTTVCPRNFAI